MQQNADATTQEVKKAVIRVDVPTRWTALNNGKLPYLDATWHDTNPPTELLSLPSNANLVQKLVEILNWSLQRPNFSAPPATGDVKQQQVDLRSGTLSTPYHPDEENTRSSLTGGTQPISLGRKLSAVKSVKADVKLAIDRVKTLGHKHDIQDAKHKKRPVLAEYISCFDEFPTSELIKVPCSHNYCKHCLSVLVITALQNESAFPTKCCLTEIPPQTIIIPLDSKQRELYKEKAAEYSIPANRRWYCPNTACTKWIPPNKLQADRMKAQTCPDCKMKICSICRGIAHKKGDCPRDFGLLEQIRLQEEQQRQQDEEEAERQLHEALRLSVQEEADAILQALMIYHQYLSLDDHQRHQEQQLRDQFEQQKGSKAEQLQANIDHNVVKRKERLKAKQDSELQALARKHQFEEDDIFLQIQLYLKDKPNSEIREKRMYDELAKFQADACQSLKAKHQIELEKLEKTASMELEGILRSHRSRERLDEEQHRRRLKKLHHVVATERIWFVTIQNRRKEMVHEHNRLVLQGFDAGMDTLGLTEELATQILPLPLQELPEEGTSSLQHTPVELEAPVQSSMNLKPARKPLKNANQVLEYLKQTAHLRTDAFTQANEDLLEAYEHSATKSASKQSSLDAQSSTAASPAANWRQLTPAPCNTNANLNTNTGEPGKLPSVPTLIRARLIEPPLTPPESPPNYLVPKTTIHSPLPKPKSLSPLANHTVQATTTSTQRPKAEEIAEIAE
ncbi:hypothetical protein DV737_g4202, partial [Chaetothyriales sp. CBS 132003]